MERAIGFMDSGLGGLGVLAAAVRHLPNERFVYLGDSANAPYGIKSDSEVLHLTKKAVATLVEQDIKALVIACNTATGAAVDALRSAYDFPIIGLEPALKVAAESFDAGSILVMATPLTIASRKYQSLYGKYGEHAVNLPCPGLMDFVENEAVGSPGLDRYLDELFEPFKAKRIDSVVLGCTHYLFLRNQIKAHLPQNTRVIDSNEGVVRQLARKLAQGGLLNTSGKPGEVRLISSGGPEKTAQLQRMFNLALATQGA